MNARLLAVVVLALTCCRRDEHILPVYDTSTPPAATAPLAPPTMPLPTDGAAGGCTPNGIGRDLTVGPGQAYASIGDVPFEKLAAGDTVRIFWREQHYHEKMMIAGIGTENAPIRVCGVPGAQGQQPVIDGQDATTRPLLDFPFDGHQPRGLIIIGHQHGEPYDRTPSYIVLEGLQVRNAAPPYTFTDRSGVKTAYSRIATGIFVERASHLTIRGCEVTANNQGIFVGTGGGQVERSTAPRT